MKRKNLITSIVLFFIALLFSVLFLINEKPKNEPKELLLTSSLNSPDSSQILDSSDSVQQAQGSPSLDNLKTTHGEKLTDNGTYTIVTAFYKESPRVELENERGEIIEFPITSIQEAEQQIRFVITEIETPDSLKKIGDTMNLAYDGENYFEYQK